MFLRAREREREKKMELNANRFSSFRMWVRREWKKTARGQSRIWTSPRHPWFLSPVEATIPIRTAPKRIPSSLRPSCHVLSCTLRRAPLRLWLTRRPKFLANPSAWRTIFDVFFDCFERSFVLCIYVWIRSACIWLHISFVIIPAYEYFLYNLLSSVSSCVCILSYEIHIFSTSFFS